MNRLRQQQGFSLIELMISIVLGMVVVSGVMAVYISTVSSSASTLKMSKLTQQLSAIMGVMTSDIRRAGYWGSMSADDYVAPQTNPFNQPDNTALEVLSANVQVAWNNAAGGSCILYSYDRNGDGIVNNADIVGFRLLNNTVQMRVNGNTANARHDDCALANDNWQNLSDGNLVKITKLNFTLTRSKCLNTREPDKLDNDGAGGVDDNGEYDCYALPPAAGSGNITVETREVTVTLEGNLANDPQTRVTMSQDVRVRNDFVRVW